jgi:hypothetical protein
MTSNTGNMVIDVIPLFEHEKVGRIAYLTPSLILEYAREELAVIVEHRLMAESPLLDKIEFVISEARKRGKYYSHVLCVVELDTYQELFKSDQLKSVKIVPSSGTMQPYMIGRPNPFLNGLLFWPIDPQLKLFSFKGY